MNEDPSAERVRVDGPADVRGEILLGPRRADGGQDRLARHNVEGRNQAERAVAAVLELETLGEARLVGFIGWMRSSAWMPVFSSEEVIERLNVALEKVAANKGAPGPDRQSVGDVRKHWPQLGPALAAALRDGTYQPGDIRRVWIPKSGGGERGLGIPNVVDRVVQEAVRSVLEPL